MKYQYEVSTFRKLTKRLVQFFTFLENAYEIKYVLVCKHLLS